MQFSRNNLWLLFFCLSLWACKTEVKEDKPVETLPPVEIPVFNADSAYHYIEKQVEFGPRVPNTEPHKKCAKWLEKQLKDFGAQVIVQEANMKAYTGKILNGKNIIASFNPKNNRRILLAAHWDSRHIADSELADINKKNDPILGADDGGSGVGVLLEIARILGDKGIKNDLGVDIILFDLEDYGQPADGGGFPEMRDSWCLGSQYWGKNLHKPGYRADFGILLDMVGSKNARFTLDGTSMHFAGDIMKKVWNIAHEQGYSKYFSYTKTEQLIDDHLYVNQLTKIPMLDIINRQPGTPARFGNYWHTHNDNMQVIDKKTLKASGQTVLAVLYHYAEGRF